MTATAGTGAPALTYQWYGGTAPGNMAAISGATSATYTTLSLTADRAYFVRITSGACSVDSATAAISMCALAQTLTGAPNVDVAQGVTPRLQLPGYGTTGNTYNWYRGNVGDVSQPVATNQTASYYDAPSQTATYWAQVVNGACTSSTAATAVRVCKVTITQQPANASINSGQNASLTLVATLGTSYQWYAGARSDTTSPVSGATGATLTISPAATASYWCRVTGSCDTVDSSAATVTVCQLPSITTQPQSYTGTKNVYNNVSVVAAGPSLTYQWYNGVVPDTSHPVSGGTAATVSVLATTTQPYWVRVSNACGSINSQTAWLSIAPTITAQSYDVYMKSGSHANASVTASGTYLTYQWYRDATSNPIGTSATLVSPPLTADATLFAYVTSGGATVSTQPVSVHLCTGPTLSGPTASSGSCKTITVGVADLSSYVRTEWYKGASGDTSQPVSSNSSNDPLYICSIPSGTQYWARVFAYDPYYGNPNSQNECYADSLAVTIP